MDRTSGRGLSLSRISRFNWATSSQKWIGENVVMRTWSNTGFNWATSSQKWIGKLSLADKAKLFQGFNWATSSQKWIDGINPNNGTNLLVVSIGPLLLRNG